MSTHPQLDIRRLFKQARNQVDSNPASARSSGRVQPRTQQQNKIQKEVSPLQNCRLWASTGVRGHYAHAMYFGQAPLFLYGMQESYLVNIWSSENFPKLGGLLTVIILIIILSNPP